MIGQASQPIFPLSRRLYYLLFTRRTLWPIFAVNLIKKLLQCVAPLTPSQMVVFRDRAGFQAEGLKFRFENELALLTDPQFDYFQIFDGWNVTI